MSLIPFTNFTKGEVSPELQARIDTTQYGSAAKRVRNFIIQKYGGLSFRPGFRVVGEVDNSEHNIRYIPFKFNLEQTYIMALENEQMRLLTNGGFVIEDNLQITAITKAVNAQVTAAYHGLEVGQRVYFDGITGMTELNYQTAYVMSVPSADTFTIDIDTTDFTTFVSSTGIVRGAPPAPIPPDPAPPPAPPAPPDPPPTTGGGGSGSSIGDLPGWRQDYYLDNSVEP